MKKTLTTLAFAFAIISTSFAQADAAYTRSLKKMFEASGTEQTFETAITQMMGMFKQQMPDVDASLWDDMEKEFLKTSINDLVEMLAPVYIKYMTQEDLDEMIRFYQSPVGKKFAKNTPLIMQESMQVGEQWGQQIGVKMEQRLKEKGY
jgi:hypothetical protein